MGKSFFLIILALFINNPALSAPKNDIRVGLGVSMLSSGANKEFKQYGIYGIKSLPWRGYINSNLNVRIDFNGSAGNIRVDNEKALYLSIGPSIEFSIYKYYLNLGINPILITKHNFYGIQLGGLLQFAVYAEIGFPIISNFSMAFRTQHISNADIYPENNGFNTYMLLLNCSL